MSVLKEEFRQLHKSYKKQLQQLQKGSFDTPTMWLDYFVSYLKFLRDSLILEEPLVLENDEENLKIASIATAITAYEKYKINLDLCQSIAKNSEENKALINKYNQEKDFYWNNFWNLIRLNMEDWLTNA